MDTIANSTVPAGSTETWRDPKRYLWLIGLVVPTLFFIGYGGWLLTGWRALFWIGPVVILVIVPAIDLFAGLDRSNPPDDVIEALEQDRYYRWITYLFLPIQYVGFVGRDVPHRPRRPAGHRRRAPALRQGRPGGLDRLHRRHRHQHRARARPQEGEPTSAGCPRSRWRRASTATSTSSTTAATTSASRRRRTRPAAGWARASTSSGRARSSARVKSAWRIEKRRYARKKQHPFRIGNDVLNAWLMSLVLWGALVAWLGVGIAALPRDPGGRRLLAARGRQLHGALRDAAPEGRRRRAAALRAGRPVALVELQQHRDQRAALPPAAAQRPPRQPDPALPDAARLRGVAGAADRVRRDDRARDRARGLAPGDGPAGARPLRRRPVAGRTSRPRKRDQILATYPPPAHERAGADAASSTAAPAAEVEVLAAQCPGCGYTYDVEAGDEHEGFAAGTAWADVPDSWCCPDCGVRDKVDFVPLDRAAAR